jgi:hypothetical protein
LAFGFDVVDWSGQIISRFEDRYQYCLKPTDGRNSSSSYDEKQNMVVDRKRFVQHIVFAKNYAEVPIGSYNGEDGGFTMKALLLQNKWRLKNNLLQSQ